MSHAQTAVEEQLKSLAPMLDFFTRITGLASDVKLFVEHRGALRSVVGTGVGGPLPCRVLLGDPELVTRCSRCDLDHLQLAHQLKRHVIYECHAGMVDIVVPILGLPVKSGVFTGQVLPRPLADHERERLIRRLATSHSSMARLRRAFAQTRYMPEDRIEAAARLLMDLVQYGIRSSEASDVAPLRTYVASELLKRQEWQELEGIARLVGVEAPPRIVFAIQVVHPGWREAVDWRGLSRAREVLAEAVPASLAIIERDKLVVLWPDPADLDSELRTLLHALRAAGLRVAIGVGRPCGPDRPIWESYHEAEAALGYRFLTDDPVIFLDAVDRETPRSTVIPSALQNLGLAIRLGDNARAGEILRTLIQELAREAYSPSWVLDCCVEILTVIIRGLREIGNRSEALPGMLRQFLSRADRGANVHEILALLESSAMRLIDQTESRVTRVADLVDRVCEHVCQHIAEPLTLERLCAEVLFVSPDHFSRIFRKAKGVRFTDWVLSQRMERARQLLTSGDHPIAVVATRCGYDDPHYFCRVFRKAVGMTPTQYRSANGRRGSRGHRQARR
jgi:AraC-like DNA-binding protein/ligand-binding sensor protein